MHIEELNSQKGMKSATVTLSYDEIRDISNGLSLLTSGNPNNEDASKYVSVANSCRMIFDLVKHGTVTTDTAYKIAKQGINSDLLP